MAWILYLLFLFPAFIFANEQYTEIPEVSSTEGLPSNLVNDSVCVISGEYTESVNDIMIMGPEPLCFGRHYSNKSCVRWNFSHMEKVIVSDIVEDDKSQTLSRIYASSGSQIDFIHTNHGKDKHKESILCKLRSSKGITNGASCLSARTNLKNQTIHYYHDKHHLKVINGAGDESIYNSNPYSSVYYLTKCNKINGHSYRYIYNGSFETLSSQINCGNHQMNPIYSSIQLHKSYNKKDPGVNLTSSDGRKIKYHMFMETINRAKKNEPPDWIEIINLWKVESSFSPTVKYLYDTKSEHDQLQLAEKQLPNGRHLKIDYYKKGINVAGGPIGTVKIEHKDDYRINRVMRQQAPVGHDDKLITTHRFEYYSKTKKHHSREETFEGNTKVYDSYDHRTDYQYDKYHRLEEIIKYSGRHHYKPYIHECYQWGSGSQEGNLIGKIIKDSENQVNHARYFHYDDKGNVLKSELCGRLTGLPSSNLIVNHSLSPINQNYEKEVKTFTYTKDDRHLPLTETDSSGVTIVNEYHKESDRLKAKWVIYDGSIQQREFYTYDRNHVLIKKITDDGKSKFQDDLSGMTERHFTFIIPRTIIPYGLPEKIVHQCLDLKTNQKITLKSEVFHYSLQGKLLQQDCYDANHQLAYQLFWEYDAHGNVIRETNALGEVSTKKYDENDNLIFEQGPSLDFHLKNTYDFSNRLICQEEVHANGEVYSTHYTYNHLNQCIKVTDTYGRETQNTFDEFGRIIQTQLPPVLNENGITTIPIVKTQYNAVGHPICVTDPKGRVTHTEFNIRGQPIAIVYPDSSIETFLYRLDGQLMVKASKDGIQTHYQRDPVGRVTQEKWVSSQGMVLKQKSYAYNALHLISSTDEMGMVTLYHYDPAGRISIVIEGEKIKQLLYDSMGRLHETREWYGSNIKDYRSTIQEYDALNRVIEERIEDTSGKIFSISKYGYDQQGNKVFVQNGDQITKTQFNSHNNPIKITNALGETTHIHYFHRLVDATGQKVLQTTTTDPLGFQTIDVYDAANRLTETSRKTPQGILVAKHNTFYDLAGNACKKQEHLIEEGQSVKTIETLNIYSNFDQIIRTIEAANTPEQKITRHTYNSLRQKVLTTKNNGVILVSDYDLLGRLKSFHSSDGSFHYLYEYNLKDLPTKMIDVHRGEVTEREYDRYGNIIFEKQGNGLITQYTYDRLGRPLTLQLPDNSSIEYHYDAVHLKEIQRQGIHSYSHQYQEHSLNGQVKESLLPDGTLAKYDYDLLQRIVGIKTPHYHQEVPRGGYNAVGNLCLYQAQGIFNNFDYDFLYQIKKESGYSNHQYQHNSLNNRTDKDGEKHIYNALNQLILKGNTRFTYDGNGNLSQREKEGPVNYTYDALDRLVAVTQGQHQIFYTYDSMNRRLTQVKNGKQELFLYQGQEEIGLVRDGEIKELKILGNSKQNPMVALELDQQTYLPVHDIHGNVALLQDFSGNVIEEYRYTAFGECEILGSDGQKIDKSLVVNPWQYASKRLDLETGFIAFGLRYYDPELGRWISQDPAGYEDGPNLYAYVHNNPLRYYDLFGLSSEGFFSESYYENFNGALGLLQYNPLPDYVPLEKFYYSCTSALGKLFNSDKDYRMPEIYQITDFNLEKAPKFSKDSKFMIGFGNGMFNEFKEFIKSMEYVSFLTKCNLTGVHSPAYIPGWDFVRTIIAKLGICTETTRKIQECWNNYLNENPNGNIIWVCHSRGAIDTKNALIHFPEELRSRIHVIAVSPGSFIEKNLCGSIKHLVCVGDPVQLFNLHKLGVCWDTIKFIKPNGLDGHSFQNEIFQDHIQEECEILIEKFKNI
ncbi:MAG: RHS repeat-associated core domain-containing protein [Parachlamydiaceae bacterium]|nr:RHS repeat-associated core domain-containing protein [Parachlamydiaceae bacterium]